MTNSGPGDATNIILSNSLPAGVGFIGISPTNQTYAETNSSIVFSLSALAHNTAKNFQLTVQATNSGTFVFVSTLSAPSVLNTNQVGGFAAISRHGQDFKPPLIVSCHFIAFAPSSYSAIRRLGCVSVGARLLSQKQRRREQSRSFKTETHNEHERKQSLNASGREQHR